MVFLDLQGPTGAMAGSEQPLLELLKEMGIEYQATPLANERNHVAATRSSSDVWFIYSNIFTSHESVAALAKHDERVAILMYQAGSLKVKPESGVWKAFETVKTLSDTFVDENRNFKMDGAEKREAFVVGAVAELKQPKTPPAQAGGKRESKHGRVAVFADASVLADGIVRNVGNALYFSDSLKWLVGESEFAGAAVSEEDVKIRHTSKEDDVWFFGSVVAMPLTVLGAGFVATRRRRDKRREKEQGHAS